MSASDFYERALEMHDELSMKELCATELRICAAVKYDLGAPTAYEVAMALLPTTASRAVTRATLGFLLASLVDANMLGFDLLHTSLAAIHLAETSYVETWREPTKEHPDYCTRMAVRALRAAADVAVACDASIRDDKERTTPVL